MRPELLLGQAASALLSPGDFLLGVILLALSVGSAFGFAVLYARRRLPALAGTPRLIAVGLLAAAGFLGIHMVPGVLGILGRPAVAVCALLLLVAALVLPAVPRGDRNPPFPPGPPSTRAAWLLAGLGAAFVAIYAIAHGVSHGDEETNSVDMLTFHLPNIARWIQNGTLWQLDEFVPYRSFGTYPNTSDVVTLGAILPFDSDFLVRFVNYPALALLGVATYALGRELQAPAAPAVLFAAGITAMPVVMEVAFNGLADTLMLAAFASGFVFLVRHYRTRARSDLLLAGLGLGISFGTKWYAPPAVAIAVAAWAVAMLLTREQRRRDTVVGLATVAAMVIVAGGFWLLRNLVETGNPVFPNKVAIGGMTLFDAPRDVQRELLGFTLYHYVGAWGVWRRILWPGFLDFLSWYSVVLWALLPLTGALACLELRRRGRSFAQRVPVLIAFATAAGIALFYPAIPYTALGRAGRPDLAVANSRYVVPALVIAAALAAWACGRIGRVAVAVEAAALVALVDALEKDTPVPLRLLLAVAAATAVVVAAVLWFRQRLSHRRGLSWRSPAAFAGFACLTLLAVGALYKQERRFNDSRFDEAEATTRWMRDHAPTGHRVGIVGEGFVAYPMFGPRMENKVDYVGPVVNGMLRAYGRKAELTAAVRRGHYDLILVQDAPLVRPGLPQRQERWVRAMGYRLVASGRQPYAYGQPSRLYVGPGAGVR